MLSSQEQMEIIKGALAEGYKGPIFKLIEQATLKKQEQAAQQEQQEQPEQRETGGLVQSYESKPPSLENLPTGYKVGKYDTLENAGIYKSGGFKKYDEGGPAHTHTDPPKEKFKTGVNSFVSGTPIQDQYDDLITINELGAGNSRTFTDDNKHNTLINKMINRGTHGYNSKTGALIKLDTPLKGLSTEPRTRINPGMFGTIEYLPSEEFMGTRAYAENVARFNNGVTSKEQDARIKKLPKEQQEQVNTANYNLRKNLVGEQNQKMVKNPLYYAPGAIAATAFGVPALAAAGEATFAGAGPSVAAAWNTTIPGLSSLGSGATFGNAINAGFATHGAMNIGPDVQDFIEDPSWEGAGKIGMDALEIAPVVGPAFRTGVEGYTAAKNVEKSAIKAGIKNTNSSLKLPNIFPKKANDWADNVMSGGKSLKEEITGKITQGRANKKTIKEANKWLEGWIKDPATQKKIVKDMDLSKKRNIEEAFDFDVDPLLSDNKFVKNIVKNLTEESDLIKNQSLNFKPNTKEYPLISQVDEQIQKILGGKEPLIHEGNYGVSYIHGMSPEARQAHLSGKAKFNDKFGSFVSRKLDQPTRSSTVAHEGTHDWVSRDALIESGQRKTILENLNPSAKKYLSKWEKLRNSGKSNSDIINEIGEEANYLGYLANPTEVHARIMQLRKHFNLKPSQKINDNKAHEILMDVYNNKTQVDRNFVGMFEDAASAKNLFNNLWVAPAVGVGAATAVASGSKKPQGMKTGGFIDRKVLYNKVNSKKIKKRKR